MAANPQKLEQVTDPARSPSLEWLGQMLGLIPKPMAPAQPDTSWHNNMVQAANQSFANQQAPPQPTQPMIRMKLPPTRRGM